MYRTHKTQELILQGLPEKYRGEIWMLFSGAINEVHFYLLKHLKSIQLMQFLFKNLALFQ